MGKKFKIMWNSIREMIQKNKKIGKNVIADLHTHTKRSDGTMSPFELVEEAWASGCGVLGVTDHNTFAGCRELLQGNGKPLNTAYFNHKGMFVVPGCEFTVVVPNVKNKANHPTKLHLLAYGCDLSEDSPISKLATLKAENDRLVDLGKLDYILEQKGLDGIIPERLIKEYINEKRLEDPGYNSLNKNDTFVFFDWVRNVDDKILKSLGLPLALREKINSALDDAGLVAKSNRALNKLYRKAPTASRLVLELKDVVDLIHASGGVAIVAHPKVNFKRTDNQEQLMEEIMLSGVDGFETAKYGRNSWFVELMEKTKKKLGIAKEFLETAGSDTHQKGADGHANIGKINGSEIYADMTCGQELFNDYLDERQRFIESGKQFESSVPEERTKELLKTYKEKSEKCKDIRTEQEKINSSNSTPKSQNEKIKIHIENGKSFTIHPKRINKEWLLKMPKDMFTQEEYEVITEFLNDENRDVGILEDADLLSPHRKQYCEPVETKKPARSESQRNGIVEEPRPPMPPRLVRVYLKRLQTPLVIDANNATIKWLDGVDYKLFTHQEYSAIASFIRTGGKDDSILEGAGLLDPMHSKFAHPVDSGYGDGM